MDEENVELDFKHLIKCALNQEITWPALKVVLESATTTLKKSKKLNNILLEQLESMQFEQTRKKTHNQAHVIYKHERVMLKSATSTKSATTNQKPHCAFKNDFSKAQ